MSRYLVSQAERSHKDFKKIIIITPHNESLGRLWLNSSWERTIRKVMRGEDKAKKIHARERD